MRAVHGVGGDEGGGDVGLERAAVIQRVAVTVMPLPDTRFGASAPAGSPIVRGAARTSAIAASAPSRRAGGAGANGSAADRA